MIKAALLASIKDRITPIHVIHGFFLFLAIVCILIRIITHNKYKSYYYLNVRW